MPPRIALYTASSPVPRMLSVPTLPKQDTEIPEFIETLTAYLHNLAQEQGSRLPLVVFQELIANLIHANFREVVITILAGGNTIRISDRGPGIADKEAALRLGFTSADVRAKQFIRGVGSGFVVAREALSSLEGTLSLEDNLDQGTVVTARIPPQEDEGLALLAQPSYNLSERQLKALLLVMELAPVGPTRIARELGVSASTAYRDLIFLEEVGFIDLLETGHRSVTEEGLKYLGAIL